MNLNFKEIPCNFCEFEKTCECSEGLLVDNYIKHQNECSEIKFIQNKYQKVVLKLANEGYIKI